MINPSPHLRGRYFSFKESKMDLYKIASKLEKDGPRDLFPVFDRKRNYHEKREYVQTVMMKLAEEDDLYLSELMDYGGSIRDLVGDILLGFSYDNNSQTHQPPEPELREHRVKILPVSKEDKKIRWKSGRRITRRSKIISGTARGSKAVTTDEPIWHNSEHDTFALPDAYKILKQSGLPIKCNVNRGRKRNGMVVEVPPWVEYGEDEKPNTASKGPGRPRKSTGG